MTKLTGFIYLAVAIVCEILATNMLKASSGFTKIVPSIAFVVAMGVSFYIFSQALVQIPLNIAYATWAGVGTVFTAIVAIIFWKESFNTYSVVGIILITTGVIILNLKGGVRA